MLPVSDQEDPMPAYILAEIQVTDAAAYEPYRPLAAASIARSRRPLSGARGRG
jgi:hypothetical protein